MFQGTQEKGSTAWKKMKGLQEDNKRLTWFNRNSSKEVTHSQSEIGNLLEEIKQLKKEANDGKKVSVG